MGHAVVAALLLGAALSSGCGRTDAAQGWVAVVPVPATASMPTVPTTGDASLPSVPAGGAASLEGLMRVVERAIAESDTARLLDLMVSEREYREIVYPALPISRPPISASFESIWITHYPDSHRGLMALLRDYGGRDIRILAIRFDAPDQDHGAFILHETSRVDIEVDGAREDHRALFGSVIHAGGQWKVLSYPD